jgi:hypothetical protein
MVSGEMIGCCAMEEPIERKQNNQPINNLRIDYDPNAKISKGIFPIIMKLSIIAH